MIEAKKEATIRTLSVEIKALTLGNRQVTLSVYRQLDRTRWLDDDGFPRGDLWGRVNYFAGCVCQGEGVHTIWKSERGLHGGCLDRNHPTSGKVEIENDGDGQLWSYHEVNRGMASARRALAELENVAARHGEESFHYLAERVNEPVLAGGETLPPGGFYGWRKAHDLASLRAGIAWADACIAASEQRLAPVMARWAGNYEKALASDQLFIAV